MKKMFLLAAAVLIGVSCESGDDIYPPVVYSNISSWDVTFKNAANENRSLTVDRSITRSSDVRGRADIVDIQPPYVRWEQFGDIYHIFFRDREAIELEIENYSLSDIVFTEKNGYMLPAVIRITAANEIYDTADLTAAATPRLYTANPFFEFKDGSSWTIRKSGGRSTGKKMVIAINPPSGWK